MQNQFKTHVKNNFSELYSGRLLLAVSGGIDSVVLMHMCAAAELDFAVAHCNFHLRGEDSDGDQQFVENLSKEMEKECLVAEFNTEEYSQKQKVSIQIAARELRYRWFDSLLEENQYDFLLTAHHLDDSMETFLINLSRGTGLEGLLGIPEQNGKIRRPLLIFSRKEIEEYAQEKGILWREDRTNNETKYLRNKIRKNILPLLKDLNGNFEQSFVNTIANLKETFVLSEDASKLHYAEAITQKKDSLCFDIKKIKKLSLPKAYLYKWLQPYGFTAWKDIKNLLDSDSGKKIYSEDYVLLKNRDELILYSAVLERKEDKYYLEQNQFLSYPLKLSVETFYDTELALDKSFILVDEDLIKFPLTVRKVKEGDSFKPFGMTGTKKVNKYFKDEKFSQFQKENTWLLCSEDKIIWIIGNRMDDRFKVQDTTTKILKIQTTL